MSETPLQFYERKYSETGDDNYRLLADLERKRLNQ